MLYFFKVLLLLINLDQETVLNWFGVTNSTNQDIFSQKIESDRFNLLNSEIESTSEVSLKTFKLIVEGLWNKVEDGLALADIETILFFILFIRFIILAIRYNLKTSFYITCIGLFAGYLWYRHLIDLISMYRSVLIKIPYLHKLGIDAVHLRSISRQIITTDLRIGDNVRWYNPLQLVYYGVIRGITHVDSETGLRYYIDPLSMIISNFNELTKTNILPVYYLMYNKLIPQFFEAFGKFWAQLSGIASYAIITRIGKRYCPYLVRWHWTFLLIIGFIEQILVYFVYRIIYFQDVVLVPKIEVETATNYIDQIDPSVLSLLLQVDILNALIAFIVSLHLGLIFFGLFHAISGQYFYLPFLVENTELHTGPRPKASIYSGGNTAWQDQKDKNVRRSLPKLWYGWFGNGNTTNFKLLYSFQTNIIKLLKKLRKQFR
jgi:Uncharacterised protein family